MKGKFVGIVFSPDLSQAHVTTGVLNYEKPEDFGGAALETVLGAVKNGVIPGAGVFVWMPEDHKKAKTGWFFLDPLGYGGQVFGGTDDVVPALREVGRLVAKAVAEAVRKTREEVSGGGESDHAPATN